MFEHFDSTRCLGREAFTAPLRDFSFHVLDIIGIRVIASILHDSGIRIHIKQVIYALLSPCKPNACCHIWGQCSITTISALNLIQPLARLELLLPMSMAVFPIVGMTSR